MNEPSRRGVRIQGVRVNKSIAFIGRVCALMVVPALAAAAGTTDEAKQLLMNMGRVAKTLDYDGTFVLRRGNELTSMHVVHTVDSDGEREHFTALDGTPREVIRQRDGVVYVLADKSRKVLDRNPVLDPLPATVIENIHLLDNYYDLSVSGSDRVAGRAAYRVVIKPKDTFRYGYRIRVDQQTGLLLRSELVTATGLVLEEMLFVSLEVKPRKNAQAAEPTAPVESAQRAEDKSAVEAALPAEQGWAVREVPTGFYILRHNRYPMGHHSGDVEHMLITDGLASVSVFIEHNDAARPPFIGARQIGAINALGRVENDYHITVVGEVPSNTVRLIGESIYFEAADNTAGARQ